jgi:hypothetical protein
MEVIGKPPANAPQGLRSSKVSAEWPGFVQRLAIVLGRLQEDQYLIVSRKRANGYVQFAGQGQWGLRAECVSNQYLPATHQLDEHQLAALRELGWRDPTGAPPELAQERDPDGSPNHFVDWPAQAPVAGLAELAARTFAEVLGVAHPGSLAYEAFDSQGQAQVFAELGLRRVARPTPAEVVADLEHRLLATVREATGLPDLDYDDDRDIQVVYGSTIAMVTLLRKPLRVRMYALVLTDVGASPALLARINELNRTLGSMHLLYSRGAVQATCEVPAWPFVPQHVENALDGLCKVCNRLGDPLQAEFGGSLPVAERMPSVTRH